MAAIYVRSTDGSNSDNGSTWALAKATLAGADAIDAGGDQIYISSVHSESTGSNVTLNLFAGTGVATPTRILSVNDGAAPPTALAAGAVVAVTNAATSLKLYAGAGGVGYCYGITFQAGNGGSSRVDLELGYTNSFEYIVHFEQCTFHINTTNAVGNIYTPSNAAASDKSSLTRLTNCYVKFGNAGHTVLLEGQVHWNGGGAAAGGTTPTSIFTLLSNTTAGIGGPVLVENCDFSSFSAGVHICASPVTRRVPFIIRNCKLPGSWSGNLVATSGIATTRVEMYNCAAGSVNYALWIADGAGSIKHETTLVRTGGASDGVTPFSWKMVSLSNLTIDVYPLVSPEISVYNSTTGSSKTLTVEILRDSATNLTDGEVWLEVNYLGSSATPVATRITDAKADTLATAADQTTSSVTWTTTGMSNPNKQKLSVTFTPQMKGWFHCKVILAKVSTTIYVDPLVTVS